MLNHFISLKIIDKNGRTVKKIGSRKSKRIFCFIQADKTKDCVFSVCVSYGKRLDNFGHMVNFNNEGEYATKKDLLHALRAFLEK